MNAEIFAEWVRKQGYRIYRSESTYWMEVNHRILQAFPFHWVIKLENDELSELVEKNRILGLRYSTGWDEATGAASYHVCFDNPQYTIESLPKKARYDVRRCLKSATVEQVSFDRMATEGWELRQETLQRQGRLGAEDREWWEKLCYSAEGLPGLEAWAVIIGREMASSLISITCDDCCSILYQQSRTKFLPMGVNNALTFVFTSEILKRSPGVWFFYGLHSLDAPPSVDEFKFRMGYIAKPVRQRVVFHPWIAPFFNRHTHRLLRHAVGKWPGDPTLAKAEGMTRFYLQGRLPIEQQALPPALAHLF